jgi:predicted Zn-dependent protease
MKKCYIILFYALFIALSGCSGTGDTSSSGEESKELKTDIPALYSSVTDISVEVFYESGAEPHTGNTQKGMPFWSILEANISELFEGRTSVPNVHVPRTISEMTEISDQKKSSWTAGEIMGLAESNAKEHTSSPYAKYYIFFLNGYLNEDGKNDTTVIGASLSGTPVIVIFEDVVVSTGGNTMLANYVEQATLVHEFGHAMGLVNNGVPLATNHQDLPNGHHCKNENCVMYWLNEGLSDMKEFVQSYMATGSPVMFGSECLKDTAGYKP